MPRQVTPATMRTQIVLQQPAETTNGLGEVVATGWTDVVTVWAEATQVRARDAFAAGKEQLTVDVIFRIRWRVGVHAGMRVWWRGEPYDIKGRPVDIDGRRQTLELACANGVRDGR